MVFGLPKIQLNRGIASSIFKTRLCRRCSAQVFWCQPDSEITSLAQGTRSHRIQIHFGHFSFSLLLHTTSVILLPFNQPDPQGLHHWSLSFTHQFSQISRSRNAHSGMQLLTCGISFRHLFVFHLQVLSHPSLIHIMDQSVTCLMVHFILVLKLIFSSSPFLHRSVSSFTYWSAGTFNCPLCGRIWRFKCRQVRQIKPAQLAFGRTIK